YLIVIGCLLGFAAAWMVGASIGLAFFIWIGLVNVFLIAQFWSYANDLYNEEQGQRLFGIIAVGGAIGAVLGPKLATLATTFALMPVAAVLMIGCLGVF